MFQKPLSDKKKLRMETQKKNAEKRAERKKIKEENAERIKQELLQIKVKKAQIMENLPDYLQNPPPTVKGKDLRTWYKERKDLLKTMVASEKEVFVIPRIITKAAAAHKERQPSPMSPTSSVHHIEFNDIQREKVDQYIAQVSKEDPPFIKSLGKRFNKIKHLKSENTNKATDDKAQPSEYAIDPCVDYEKIKNLLVDSVTFENSKNPTLTEIKDFLQVNKSETTINNDYTGNDAASIIYNMASSENNDDILATLDKYKRMEETPFKGKFLYNICGSIESNLEKVLKTSKKLKKNSKLDTQLYNSYVSKNKSPMFNKMLRFRFQLPAFKLQKKILSMLKNHQVLLISGDTGSGKTTQIAQFILDDAIINKEGSKCNIICTQPRQISAISVATRVAQERGETVGKESVGYHVRLQRAIGRNCGAILFCTTGMLLQYLQSDPALQSYSHVILDEIHERDIMCDFALTIVRDIIAKRKDLKVILMSATFNAEQFSKYFDNCPTIEIIGRMHPVEEYYLEDVLQKTNFNYPKMGKSKDSQAGFKEHVLPYVEELRRLNTYSEHVLQALANPDSEKINHDLIVELLNQICTTRAIGAILVFLPGWDDINAVMKKIKESNLFPEANFWIIPLHSMLPANEQQSVFDHPPPGVRKIVLSTNIAETSVTIDDVVYVIDSGKMKIKSFDVNNNISTLKSEFVSKANARQRRGRAGRVRSGVCYHLFSKGRERALADYPLPDFLRTRLEEVILNLKILQLGRAGPFLQKVMNPPNPKAVSLALELLYDMTAIDELENLTPLGYHLAKLPLDPQIGKMLLMSVIMSCLGPVLNIASILAHKDPFYLPLGQEKLLSERKLALDKGRKSDHLIMSELVERWEEAEYARDRNFCSQNFITRSTMFMLRNMRNQFFQYLREMDFIQNNTKELDKNSSNIAIVKAVICSALYPNVAVIKKSRTTNSKQVVKLCTHEDGNVALHPKSVNYVQQNEFESRFLVYHEKLKTTNTFLYDTTMISALPMIFFANNINIYNEEKYTIILELNEELKFACSSEDSKRILELKIRLNWLLDNKLQHPGSTGWSHNSSEEKLLMLLTELFTHENDLIMKST